MKASAIATALHLALLAAATSLSTASIYTASSWYCEETQACRTLFGYPKMRRIILGSGFWVLGSDF